MFGCESWTIKKAEGWRFDAIELWCWRRLLRVPWTTRRSNQSILKEISPELFIGRSDAEIEAPVLWPPDVKDWLIEKDPDAGKDWRQVEKGNTEDEMVGWYHQLDGHEFEQALGVGEGQGSLASCSPWGGKESDTTKQLNWTIIGVLAARIMQWVATSSSSDPCFVITLHYDPLSWVALHVMAHSLTELHKPLCQVKALLHEGH